MEFRLTQIPQEVLKPELFTRLFHFEVDEFALRIPVNQSETSHQLFLRGEGIITSHDVILFEGTALNLRVTPGFIGALKIPRMAVGRWTCC